MTITEFLEARLSEDEAVARAAAESDPSIQGHYMEEGPAGTAWTAEDGMVLSESGAMWDCEGSATLCTTTEVAEHFARHDPARVLAECAAKRAIIQSHASSAAARPNAAFGQRFVLAGMETGLEIAMKALAAIYASHPDYEPGWEC
jgi:hypothetical protein